MRHDATFLGWVLRDAIVRATLIVAGTISVTAPITSITYMNNRPVVVATEENEYVVGE